ncbi:MAG: hypothetical protein EOP48_27360, partial [Sphingobacteriales bacterium]
QLVEHNLAKVGVGSSSLLSRSRFKKALVERLGLFLFTQVCWKSTDLSFLMSSRSFSHNTRHSTESSQ